MRSAGGSGSGRGGTRGTLTRRDRERERAESAPVSVFPGRPLWLWTGKGETARRGLRRCINEPDSRLTVAGRIEIDRDEPGVAVVSLVGEHELYAVLEVEHALDHAIHDGLALVIDLTRTEFVDSSVVAILLRAREAAHGAGTGFALVIDDSTGPSVRQLFEITGLASIFRVASSRADALAP